jgi:hypothetical protein
VLPLSAQNEAEFKLVVNASNPADEMPKKQVSRFFLKKEKTWPNGLVVAPVDQLTSSPIREVFSKVVHGKRAQAIENYWQKLIFSGSGTPPLKLASDEEILEFILYNVGAIGYVAAETTLFDGVKALEIRR